MIATATTSTASSIHRRRHAEHPGRDHRQRHQHRGRAELGEHLRKIGQQAAAQRVDDVDRLACRPGSAPRRRRRSARSRRTRTTRPRASRPGSSARARARPASAAARRSAAGAAAAAARASPRSAPRPARGSPARAGSARSTTPPTITRDRGRRTPAPPCRRSRSPGRGSPTGSSRAGRTWPPTGPSRARCTGRSARYRIPELPAMNGASARTRPMNRPTRIVLPPWRAKYASTCSKRSWVILTFGPWRSTNSRPSRVPM